MEKRSERQIATPKKRGYIKLIRIVLYIISVLFVAVGIGLIKTATTSESFSNGTHDAVLSNGNVIFFTSLVVLTGNIFWGMMRWFLSLNDERPSAGRIIGKLIGGGLWRTLVFVPLFLVGLFAMTPLFQNIINNSIIDERNNVKPIDLAKNERRLKYIAEHLDDMDAQEALAEVQELMLMDLEFDPEYREGATGFTLPFENKVLARTKNVSTLTSAVLSPSGKFVIFYTLYGDDAITHEQANNLAKMFDDIIAGYKNNLGFEYKYEKIGVGITKENGIKNVLKANNIDANILDTAMPVYVADPYSEYTGVLASYAGRRFTDLGTSILITLGGIMGEETAKLYSSAPSYPFVNILPLNVDDDSLETVVAHELGHHYAALYNFDTFGTTGSDDDFIDETGPNWMAINAVGSGPITGVLNGGHYNRTYLKEGTGYTISKVTPDFDGYPPYAFLQNYYELVPDSKTKIMNAIYYGDALPYLYDQAGEKLFQKVMTQLAERNLTGEYGGKIVNYVLPQGEEIYCTDACVHTYQINPAATEYLYFTPDEYDDVKITFKGNEKVTASVLAHTVTGGWQVLAHASDAAEIDFSDEDYRRYVAVALAVSSADITNEYTYNVEIVKTELEEMIDEEGEFDWELADGELFVDLGGGCYLLNMDSLFNMAGQFMDLGSQLLGAISQFDDSGEISNAKAEYDAEVVEAKQNLETARTETSQYNISFCANLLKDGLSFDAAKAKLQSSLGWTINVYNENSGKTRMSAFAGFDVLKRSGKGYLLVQDSGELGLVTINIDAK